MNSWDCFDTLIARAYKEPKSIFDIVAKKINDPLFQKKRILAEKQSIKKTYEDIYYHLPGYDPKVELDTEKEYSFPIKQNLNRVKDGDIIISDMYLSSDQIRELLDYHGLNKDVKIFVSYSGKHTGLSWKSIKNITSHCGDNIKSDIMVARKFGIKSHFFSGSNFTPEEKLISKANYNLALLMRRSRLSNPYDMPFSHFIHDNGSFDHIAGHLWTEEINGYINSFNLISYIPDQYIILKRLDNKAFVKIFFSGESFYSNNNITYDVLYTGKWLNPIVNYDDSYQKLIWSDQSQFNLPILILVSLFLPQDKKICFSQRDCFYLHKIYKAITQNNDSCILDVSRQGYYHPFNKNYIQYLIEKTKDCIIVDSHGTGNSAIHFLNQNMAQNIPQLFHICKHPQIKLRAPNDIISLVDCRRKFDCVGRWFEKLNINSFGPLIGWDENKNIAIRAECEHNKVITQTMLNFIDNTIEYINYYNITNTPELIHVFLNKLKNTFTEQFVTTIWR